MLTASLDEAVKLWPAASGECLRTLEGHVECVTSAASSPEGQQVLTAAMDGPA